MAAASGPSGARRHRLAEVALVCAAAMLPLLGLEAFLRLRGVDTRSFTRPDPLLGWSYVPGAAYVHESAEACPGWGSSGTINSWGLRDHEHALPRPPGTVRILAVGDSFTEAFQFDLDRTWTKLLEKELDARDPGRRHEVINAGRSGMGTTTEWLYYKERGRELGADVVLLLFIPNDFQDNSKRLALATAYGPFLVPGPAEGEWSLDTSFRSHPDYRMRTRLAPFKRASYVVSAAVERYQVWRATRAAQRFAASRGGAAGKVDVAARRGFGVSLTEDDFLWVAEPRADWAEAARITQEALHRLGREVQDAGARLVVFGGTSNIQVHPEARARALAEHPDWDLDRPASYVRAVADEEGFAFDDLVPAFREAAADGAYLHGCAENGGEGHWSEAGNRTAAREMARFLDESGLLEDR